MKNLESRVKIDVHVFWGLFENLCFSYGFTYVLPVDTCLTYVLPFDTCFYLCFSYVLPGS